MNNSKSILHNREYLKIIILFQFKLLAVLN